MILKYKKVVFVKTRDLIIDLIINQKDNLKMTIINSIFAFNFKINVGVA